jgi:hypothetical protein
LDAINWKDGRGRQIVPMDAGIIDAAVQFTESCGGYVAVGRALGAARSFKPEKIIAEKWDTPLSPFTGSGSVPRGELHG